MKESKIYWQVKRDLLSQLLKSKPTGVTLEDLYRGLLKTAN
jgi:hypothetical protein